MSRTVFFRNSFCLITLIITILFAPMTYFSINYLQELNFEYIHASHWSGYLVKADNLSSWQGVSSVSASWIVPEIKTSVENTSLSIWVGVGGYGEESLIQAGIGGHCVNGQVQYYAWYELLPNFATPISSILIHSGDVISVSIALIDEKQTWSIIIDDKTSGGYFQKNVIYNSSRLTAEWIIERPLINDVISNLPDFGNATFSNCKAELNGLTGEIDSFTYYKLILVDPQNRELVTVSPLSDSGKSFTVAFL